MIRTIEKLVDELVAAHEKKPFEVITCMLDHLRNNEKDHHDLYYYEHILMPSDQEEIVMLIKRLITVKLRVKELEEENNNQLAEELQKAVQEEIKKSSKVLWEGEK